MVTLAIRRIVVCARRRLVILSACLLAAGALYAAAAPFGPVAAQDARAAPKPPQVPKPARKFRVNVEKIYYQQFRLISEATRNLAEQRPGLPDLYFIGFAGDAHEDVFLRELRSVGKLFDDRFDTKNRSVLLINNPKTVGTAPLANSHNLLAALDQVRNRMDPDEDVLFLFLTSHGDPDLLSVNFKPMRMNNLRAQDLRHLLDRSQIKWRVIVVSACYSGSFVDDLKDENSLIVTAARHDRPSFGCSHENDFTYFGRAYFDRALRESFSFTDAFASAVDMVTFWEKAENLQPSLPQIHVGAAIRPKLKEIEARLRLRYASRGDGPKGPAQCCARPADAPDEEQQTPN
ncbi:MAG: C13 family peptidase [Alphaproteobacteria bacterium]|nr:C13 family peptidase [Alphaproteobacteria bacterium]